LSQWTPPKASRWIVLAIGLAGTLGAAGLTRGESSAAAPGVDVVFLANEGVYLTGGERGVLLDGCVRVPYLEYGAVPDEVWEKLLRGEAPFERLDLVLVSHAHRDHFQVEAARELLLARRETRWVVHREVATAIESGWTRWPEVTGQVTAVAPVDGERAAYRVAGLEVELLRLPHGPARSMPENLAHVVQIGGRTLVHVGDARASREDLARAGLQGRRFDVALLPFWYWGSPTWSAALDALAGRLGSVALHRPPGDPLPTRGEGSPHDFSRPLERLHY
jgi:L-ascorbate metabolism protein UlaG (beta-lactamase superfamily)